MTNSILEKALKEFISEVTKDFTLPVPGKKQEDRTLRVLSGFLPPESTEDEIPAVAVRVLKVKDNPEERDFIVRIYAVIYDKDTGRGYDNLVLILQRIIDKINETQIIGDYFAITGNSEYEVYEEQPYPFWMGDAELVFKGPKTTYTGYF